MHKQKSLFQALASGQQNDETKQTNRRYPLLYFCVVWLEGSYYSLGFSVSVCNSFLFLLCTPQKPYKTLKVSPLNHFSQCAAISQKLRRFITPVVAFPSSLPSLFSCTSMHFIPSLADAHVTSLSLIILTSYFAHVLVLDTGQ